MTSKIRPMQFYLKFIAEPATQKRKRETFKELTESAREELRDVTAIYNDEVRQAQKK